MTQSFLIKHDLVGRPRFFHDPLFWVAIAGGGIVALGISLWIPVGGPVPDSSIARIILSTVIVYPVIEELVFRGALQGWLLRRSWGERSLAGLTIANLVTTGAFTGLHFLYHPPLFAVSVAVPSLVFGWFRDREGTVYPGICLHVAYNLFYLVAVMAG